jgi:type III pantothenate kinase
MGGNKLILCIGIGNTHTKCAIGYKKNYQQITLLTEKINQPDDFILSLETQFKPNVYGMLQGCIVSSVVPDKTSIIIEAVRHMNNEITLQRFDVSKCNIDVTAYKSKLGEDRAVCCAGALAKYKPPFVVVDFGTATTVNVINLSGVFIGGAIMVGVQMGLDALNRNTAQLPIISNEMDVAVICDNTQDSLASGAFIGTSYAIEGYIKHIQTMLNVMPTVIFTGGAAPLVIPHYHFDFIYEPMLLIDGLFELYAK